MIMKKTTWACIFVGVAIIIVVAIVITLILALKKHDKDDESSSSTISFLLSTEITTTMIFESTTPEGPLLDDEISLNSTFPNGSLTFDINELSQGLSEDAPLEVNITLLNQIGINVDNSSFVAETGRMSFFYIRLPPPNVTRMEGDAEVQGNIGIRFGNSSFINVIPLSLASKYDSGLSLAGKLPDSSGIYLLKIRMAENMCSNSAEGACSVISWKPYSISESNKGSPGNFDNPLPIACGSQCDAASNSQCASSSCTTCDGQQVAGTDTPVTRRYKMGRTSGTVMFTYNTYTVKDRIKVTYEDKTLFDSCCVGESKTVPITFSGKSQELRVDVEPNCDGTSGTAWDFTLPCLSPCGNYSKDSSLVHLMAGPDEIQNGGIAYITKEALMPSLTAYYCDAQNSQGTTITWKIKVEYEYTICLEECNKTATCCKTDIKQCHEENNGYGSPWDIPFGTNVRGGNATLTWSDSQNGTIKFIILGTQPSNNDVIDYITQQTSLWFAKYVAKGENEYFQFGRKQPLGYPSHSIDYGYGIYQITKSPAPTCDDLWNWEINVDDGINILNEKVDYAYNNWMHKQRKQAKDQNNGTDIPVPCHAVANCVFMDGSDSPIEDAVAMKYYNGASNFNYCSWNNTRNCWQFSELSSNGNNYVQHICEQVPKNSKTCPPPISNSSNYAC